MMMIKIGLLLLFVVSLGVVVSVVKAIQPHRRWTFFGIFCTALCVLAICSFWVMNKWALFAREEWLATGLVIAGASPGLAVLIALGLLPKTVQPQAHSEISQKESKPDSP